MSSELSAGWVARGLGCVGLGRNGSKICVFSGLGWVMGLKWQMCEKYMSCVYITVSSIDWQIRFVKTCSNASDTVGVCIVTMCIRMMMMT